MQIHKLARLLAVVSITLLGTLAVLVTPSLFDRWPVESVIDSSDTWLQGLLIGGGIIVAAVSYLVLKLLTRSDRRDELGGAS